jgi:hypothetical protein
VTQIIRTHTAFHRFNISVNNSTEAFQTETKWTEVWFLFFIMIITFWVNWNFLLVRQFCSSKNIIFHVSQFFFIYLSTKRESKHNDSLWKVSNILFWFSIILKESCFQTMFCFLCRTTWLSVWSELQYKRI